MSLQISQPQLLTDQHWISNFSCGEPSLDDWLKRRAFKNQNALSTTHVVVDQGRGDVVGYYTLAAGAVSHNDATRKVRSNAPDPVPVIVLGRLAVDMRAQGCKLGAALLRDAVIRSQEVTKIIGARALLVHALNDHARQFYEHYGFQASPVDPMMLMLCL